MSLLKTSIGRLRLAGIAEGASFLVLLFIAMPLKYWADIPLAVRVAGLLHGIFFLTFCLALLMAMLERRWTIWKAAFVFIMALVPFGPFLIDDSLRREEEDASS